jgi:hypothetical protein
VNQIKKHYLGLAYMAISRVKALSGILFESAFDFDRFKCVDSINSRDVVGIYYSTIEQENCYCYTSYRPFRYANLKTSK